MKPVRLPAAATKALPRWGLIALALLYILPGLVGRDPWKNEDATGFGLMLTMAQGTWQDWLSPNVMGLPLLAESPLAYWLGALSVKLFGGILGEPMAARMLTIISFLVGALSLWYATYLLGRRNEAQPQKLAFGGQPSPQAFGRTLADGAFLIYLASLGLLLHSHETTSKTLQIALTCLAMLAAVRVFDSKLIRSAVFLGITLGLLVMTRGLLLPAAILIGLFILACTVSRRQAALLAGITLPAALLIVWGWIQVTWTLLPETAIDQFDTWLSWHVYQLNWPTLHALDFLTTYGLWFAWPAWPLAGWALYAWRRQLSSLHIALPLAFLLPVSAMILLNVHIEGGMLLPLLPPLAILAAFGLPTMKRGAINAIDWFAMIGLSLIAAFIWLAWIAIQTGWPAHLARNVSRQAPGFTFEVHALPLLLALLATAAWLVLINWRIWRRPQVLWRAVVLSSGGVILCWFLLMTLWLPAINYSKSYAGVSQALSVHLPTNQYCVATNVGSAQRASFAYFAGVRFQSQDQAESDCRYLLLQDNVHTMAEPFPDQRYPGKWSLLWEGRRPSDRTERFRLYYRKSSR